MSSFEIVLATGSVVLVLIILLMFLRPLAEYYFERASQEFHEASFRHQHSWFTRTNLARMENLQIRSQQQFLQWLNMQVNGELNGGQIDESLLTAQRLTPLLRFLLQEEIPSSIRKCNVLHRRMALITGAVHMRDVAYEQECHEFRRWMVTLLANTDALFQQYPIKLRLEADELLTASLAVRKGLLPICARCPYIQRTVAAAGERCPAAELISIEVIHT